MKVSVVLKTYNHERFIRQALDSILMQETTFDFDIVITEDCSNDSTQAILVEYQLRYPGRISLMLSERNLNSNYVTRRAIEAAQGEYLALLDGDDYWISREKLERQVSFLDSNPDCALCCHAVNWVDECDNFLRGPWPFRPRFSTIEDLAQSNFIPFCSALIRRSALGILPLWYEQVPYDDWPLYLLAARCGRIGFIPEIFGAYRQHATGSWSSLTQSQKYEGLLACLDVLERNLGSDFKEAFQRSRVTLREQHYMREALAEQERTISERGAQIARLTETIAFIHASRSWRITAPLRLIGGLINRMAKSA